MTQTAPGTRPDDAAPAKGEATGREFIALVTALMAMTALGIDLMLPAFPDIRSEFGLSADSTKVTWIITAYFLGMAIGPWLFGPASDRYGRRRLVFLGLALYAIGATAAATSTTWEVLIIARFVWGVGASGPRSLAVTIIRDRHEGSTMARLMSMIMAVFMLVPIIAPALGAGLISFLPWRAVFWFPAAMAVVLMVWTRRLPETLSDANRRPFTFRSVAGASREVVRHRQTVALTIAMTFLYSMMTSYLAGSEVILGDVYGYADWFPFFFGAVAVLLAANSLSNARLVQRLGVIRLLRTQSVLGIAACALLFGVSLLNGGVPNFWLFTLCVCLVMPLVQGLSPSSNTAAMTPLPHVAGTASAIIATVTTAGGAVLGGIASSAFNGTVRPFATYFLVFMTCTAGCIWWGTAAARRVPAPATA